MSSENLLLKDGTTVSRRVAELVDDRFRPLFNGNPASFDTAVSIAHGGEAAYVSAFHDFTTITNLRAWQLLPPDGGMADDVAAVIRLMVPNPNGPRWPAIPLKDLLAEPAVASN